MLNYELLSKGWNVKYLTICRNIGCVVWTIFNRVNSQYKKSCYYQSLAKLAGRNDNITYLVTFFYYDKKHAGYDIRNLPTAVKLHFILRVDAAHDYFIECSENEHVSKCIFFTLYVYILQRKSSWWRSSIVVLLYGSSTWIEGVLVSRMGT